MQPAELKDLVSALLSHIGVEVGDITIAENHRTVMAVTSPDSKMLIGPSGEHLRALNSIARRLAEAKFGEGATGFLIDVNGFHEAQLEVVRQNALMLAQRARLFKRDVEMDPMSSYERLVVHELFAEDPEIKTESAGEGKFRHIVLRYKNDKHNLQQVQKDL